MREDALAWTGGKCAVCGGDERLEVHETYVYDYWEAIATYVCAVPLCVPCHRFVHLDITYSRWLAGAVSQEVLVAVINHGCKLLREADLWPTDVQYYLITNVYGWLKYCLDDSVEWFATHGRQDQPPKMIPWDMRQWRLFWNGNLYKEVPEASDYEFDIESLALDLEK